MGKQILAQVVDVQKYIELTEENYFKALKIGLIPMDWIKRCLFKK